MMDAIAQEHPRRFDDQIVSVELIECLLIEPHTGCLALDEQHAAGLPIHAQIGPPLHSIERQPSFHLHEVSRESFVYDQVSAQVLADPFLGRQLEELPSDGIPYLTMPVRLAQTLRAVGQFQFRQLQAAKIAKKQTTFGP